MYIFLYFYFNIYKYNIIPKENGNNSSYNFLKTYTLFYIGAELLIILALFWSIGLSGAQIGSSTTIGT